MMTDFMLAAMIAGVRAARTRARETFICDNEWTGVRSRDWEVWLCRAIERRGGWPSLVLEGCRSVGVSFPFLAGLNELYIGFPPPPP